MRKAIPRFIEMIRFQSFFGIGFTIGIFFKRERRVEKTYVYPLEKCQAARPSIKENRTKTFSCH
ncbi:MAG: hypothetical protein COZ11_14685 [Deltaproteobacteria bacterium CG_4_10_14_3_um_filter_51_14]|nr:MAG: hypothetical protein COZ11_14685 [Deltaproteobacteria bacterium CG_4_10_14_3_um_filter_51_14]